VPPSERRAAFGFASFANGLDACRRVIQRGATPAVLRLYDPAEAQRSYSIDAAVLLVRDEGDGALLDGVMRVVDDECRGADRLDDALVEQWMGHRNDVSALEALTRKDFVVDTIEIAARWSVLAPLYERVTNAIKSVEHALVATAHQSHAYVDGACLYFTFAGRPPADAKDSFYRSAWDAATTATLEAGGALSHHHGVGINRSRFMADALGSSFPVLASVKRTLDPNGILNPGKLGLASPFGAPVWP
jgi:alkyldihydroxyacetonephosphate synthase